MIATANTIEKPDAGKKLRKTSARKVNANRKNSRKSTGPRTKEGKNKVRKNALKHGLFAAVLPEHDMPFLVDKKEYEELMVQYVEDFQPTAQFEVTLVESLALDTMRLRHIHALELTIWDSKRLNEKAIWDLEARMFPVTSDSDADQVQSDIDLLEKFDQLLATDEKIRFGKGEVEQLAAMLEDYRKFLIEQVVEMRNKTKAASNSGTESLQSSAPSAPKEDEPNKYLVECEHEIRILGGDQPKISVLQTIQSILTKKNSIPKEDVEHWRYLLYGRRQLKSQLIKQIKKYRANLQDLKNQSLADLMDEYHKLEMFNRYETMVRRNIDRTLGQINQFRKLKKECPG